MNLKNIVIWKEQLEKCLCTENSWDILLDILALHRNNGYIMFDLTTDYPNKWPALIPKVENVLPFFSS